MVTVYIDDPESLYICEIIGHELNTEEESLSLNKYTSQIIFQEQQVWY